MGLAICVPHEILVVLFITIMEGSGFFARSGTEPSQEGMASRESQEKETVRTKVHEMFETSFSAFSAQGKLPDDSELPFRRSTFDDDDFIVVSGVMKDVKPKLPRVHPTEALLQFLGVDEKDESEKNVAFTQERVATFFNELIHFLKEERRDPKKQEKLKEYVQAWSEWAFSFSTNIFYRLSPEDQFTMNVQLLRITEAWPLVIADAERTESSWEILETTARNLVDIHRRYLGQNGFQETLEKLLGQFSLENQIGFIHDLTEPRHTPDVPEESWGDPTSLSIRRFLETVQQSEQRSPLLVHAAEQNLIKIQRIENGVSEEEQAEEARNRFLQESQRIEEVVEVVVEKGDEFSAPSIFRWMSRDAIVSYSATMLPISYTEMSPSQITKKRFGYEEKDFVRFGEGFEGNERFMLKGAAEGVDAATLLQELHRPAMREAIEQDMGISLADLSLREQIQLLSFLARSEYGTAHKSLETVKRHGVNGARAFLSCEYGQHFGDAILKISESLDQKSADAIFSRYAEIADVVERETEQLLKDFFVMENGQKVDRSKINDELLGRAKTIISTFATRLEKGEKIGSEEVLRELDHFQRDTVLFASMFKESAKGKSSIEFENIRGLSFEQKNPADLTNDEREEMLHILDENWRTQMPSVASFVRAGFEKKIDPANTATRFHVLKKNGKVIASVRFDERPDLGPNVLYGGSLNVSPELRGSALGESVMRKTVDDEARDHVIYADFFPEVAAGSMYVEQFRFVVVGVEEVKVEEGGASERRLVIMRDDAINGSYRARQEEITRQQLIERGGENERDGIQVRRFEFPKQKKEFVDAVDRATKNGLVMTRYFADEKDKNIRYVAFEPDLSASEELRRAA